MRAKAGHCPEAAELTGVCEAQASRRGLSRSVSAVYMGRWGEEYIHTRLWVFFASLLHRLYDLHVGSDEVVLMIRLDKVTSWLTSERPDGAVEGRKAGADPRWLLEPYDGDDFRLTVYPEASVYAHMIFGSRQEALDWLADALHGRSPRITCAISADIAAWLN